MPYLPNRPAVEPRADFLLVAPIRHGFRFLFRAFELPHVEDVRQRSVHGLAVPVVVGLWWGGIWSRWRHSIACSLTKDIITLHILNYVKNRYTRNI